MKKWLDDNISSLTTDVSDKFCEDMKTYEQGKESLPKDQQDESSGQPQKKNSHQGMKSTSTSISSDNHVKNSDQSKDLCSPLSKENEVELSSPPLQCCQKKLTLEGKSITQKMEAEEALSKTKQHKDTNIHSDCVSRKEFKELKDEVRRLKRKFQELVKTESSGSPCTQTPTVDFPPSPKAPDLQSPSSAAQTTAGYNGFTLSDLKDSICHIDKLYEAVKCLMLKLFSKDYIVTHSVSGKAANSKTANKCQFDSRLYFAMLGVLKEKFDVKNKDITEKVHSVQKFVAKQLSVKK